MLHLPAGNGVGRMRGHGTRPCSHGSGCLFGLDFAAHRGGGSAAAGGAGPQCLCARQGRGGERPDDFEHRAGAVRRSHRHDGAHCEKTRPLAHGAGGGGGNALPAGVAKYFWLTRFAGAVLECAPMSPIVSIADRGFQIAEWSGATSPATGSPQGRCGGNGQLRLPAMGRGGNHEDAKGTKGRFDCGLGIADCGLMGCWGSGGGFSGKGAVFSVGHAWLALATKGLLRSVKGLHRPAKGLRRPAKGLHRSVKGLHRSVKGLRRSVKGLRRPVKGLLRPVKGLLRPVKGLRRSVKGLRRSVKGLRHSVQRLRRATHVPFRAGCLLHGLARALWAPLSPSQHHNKPINNTHIIKP